MSGEFSLGNPTVKINNETTAIVPNTFKYTEGKGETLLRTQTTGAGKVEIVASISAEDQISTCSFDVINTENNIKRIRGVKSNPNNNVIQVTEGGFSRVIASMSITNNYEVELSATGKLSIECGGKPSI